MHKYEYKCNKCLIIEEKWVLYTDKPSNSVTCHKCGGMAIRLQPFSEKKDVFEDYWKGKGKFD